MKYFITYLIFISLFLVGSCQSVTNYLNIAKDNNLNILHLAWQDDKYLWVSTYNQLFRWDTQTKQREVFKDYSGELYVDSENVLWVFDRGIVRRFDGQNWEHFSSGKELAPGPIFTFIEAEGYIWVGTKGLSRYSQAMTTWEILLDAPPGPLPTPIPDGEIAEVLSEGVHSVAPISPDAVWIGTSKGLTYWESDYQQTWGNRILETDGVRCMLRASPDEVWICTEHGIGRWNGHELKDFLRGWNDHQPHLIEGQGGEIWTSAGEGVSQWDGKEWVTWTDSQEVRLPPNLYARVGGLLFSPADASIWIIVEDGIGRWNGEKWQTYTDEDGLTIEYIGVIMQDSEGTVWAGGRSGINYYDSNTDKWYPFP